MIVGGTAFLLSLFFMIDYKFLYLKTETNILKKIYNIVRPFLFGFLLSQFDKGFFLNVLFVLVNFRFP